MESRTWKLIPLILHPTSTSLGGHWSRILTPHETIVWNIAWKITHLPWGSGKHCLRPRKLFRSLFFFCSTVTPSLSLSPFHIFIFQVWCVISLKFHNFNDSTIKVSSFSPLGEIVLYFCCISTHNLCHQRACPIVYHLFNLIFVIRKISFLLPWWWRLPSTFT